ncbi:hypothetical protein KM043_013380 [Ampulex compressa]|nr:hypothetical protein KM043_013380 [Ampulex compressa]
MAQGKLKVKDKRPSLVKEKSKKTKKEPAHRRRGNAPVQPKTQHQEAKKLKKMITKIVDQAMEEELSYHAYSKKKGESTKESAKGKKTPVI